MKHEIKERNDRKHWGNVGNIRGNILSIGEALEIKLSVRILLSLILRELNPDIANEFTRKYNVV